MGVEYIHKWYTRRIDLMKLFSIVLEGLITRHESLACLESLYELEWLL